jgi:hypothetical protein
MQYKPFEKGIEVIGQTVYAIVDGINSFKGISSFKKLAPKHLLAVGIGEKDGHEGIKIDPAAWYSQEEWLKAFESIGNEVGVAVLYEIGQVIPKNAKFPPWVVDVDSAIKSIDIAYHMNHRKGGQAMFDPNTGKMLEGIGHYGYQRVEGRNMIISVCENPYPCSFDRGIITTMAKKFQPSVSVIHDNSEPCRKNGAESCTYIITW